MLGRLQQLGSAVFCIISLEGRFIWSCCGQDVCGWCLRLRCFSASGGVPGEDSTVNLVRLQRVFSALSTDAAGIGAFH